MTITHKKITRFFITINLTVTEIFESLKIMSGGEIFIINNMMSFRIYDLAKALKEYFKYKKKIIVNGIREGEKLYEELATKKEMMMFNNNKNLLIIKDRRKFKNLKPKKKEYLHNLNSNNAKLLNKYLIIKFLKKSKLI